MKMKLKSKKEIVIDLFYDKIDNFDYKIGDNNFYIHDVQDLKNLLLLCFVGQQKIRLSMFKDYHRLCDSLKDYEEDYATDTNLQDSLVELFEELEAIKKQFGLTL